MSSLTTTQLANELGVSKARVSQYVSEGKLEGCFSGKGRARRFDLEKAAKALGRKLDAGQLMGNGAGTKRALDKIATAQRAPRPDAPLGDGDSDRYELARIQKAEEEARRMRRINAEAEGTFVLASEVALQTSRIIGQEIAEIETVLRDAARVLADELHIDFKVARRILLETWRSHRATRSRDLEEMAKAAKPTPAESEADF